MSSGLQCGIARGLGESEQWCVWICLAVTLELGWAGDTADEAQAFVNKWNSKMDELFGTADHPEDGVLVVMAGGLDAAAIGYSQTDAQVEQMFKEFATVLGSPGSNAGTPTSTPADQGAGTAVTEDFP